MGHPWCRSAMRGLTARLCPAQRLWELEKRTELQDLRAKQQLLEQKLHRVEGNLEQVETINGSLDLQVVALSSQLGQAEARMSALRSPNEELRAQQEAAQAYSRQLHTANKALNAQCHDARTQTGGLQHQIRDLTVRNQEADQRVREIQVKHSVMSRTA